MTLDTSIPLDTKVPNPMQPISGMLNIASGVQNMQAQRLKMQGQQQANQQGAIDLQERSAMQSLLSNPSQFENPDGSVNYPNLLQSIMRVAPTTGMKYASAIATADQQATTAKKSLLDMNEDARTTLGRTLYSMKGQPQDVVDKTISAMIAGNPQLKTGLPYVNQLLSQVRQAGGQPAVDAALDKIGKSVMSAPEQIVANTPQGVPVTDNRHSYVVNAKPGVYGIPQGAVIPGTGATMQPPPTQPTVGGPEGTTPGIIGPSSTPAPGQLGGSNSGVNSSAYNGYNGGSPQAAAVEQRAILTAELNRPGLSDADRAAVQRELARLPAPVQQQPTAAQQQPRSGFIPTALPPGQAANLQNNFDQMNAHYAKLQGPSSDAQLALGLTGNIESLAKDALTGTESGREAYVNGLLNTIGLGGKSTGNYQTDTDLLEKNLAQLNLATPAATDAMRVLVSAARPHSTMSAAAIEEAARQVSSQIQANVAIRNYLTPYKFANGGKGDPQGYQAARQQIENVADPRAWEYAAMPHGSPQAIAFASKLTPQDRAGLSKKIEQLEQMGLLK